MTCKSDRRHRDFVLRLARLFGLGEQDALDVQQEVSLFATVRVTQKYRNPFEEKIEAVYVFPLPAEAVSDFVPAAGCASPEGRLPAGCLLYNPLQSREAEGGVRAFCIFVAVNVLGAIGWRLFERFLN